VGQPTADGARLSILCILDMSPIGSPIGTAENYIWPVEPAHHGLTNPRSTLTGHRGRRQRNPSTAQQLVPPPHRYPRTTGGQSSNATPAAEDDDDAASS
jgi:hypothetical protein